MGLIFIFMELNLLSRFESECCNYDFWYQVYCNTSQSGAAVVIHSSM